MYFIGFVKSSNTCFIVHFMAYINALQLPFCEISIDSRPNMAVLNHRFMRIFATESGRSTEKQYLIFCCHVNRVQILWIDKLAGLDRRGEVRQRLCVCHTEGKKEIP